jgi:hypothetical protein
MRAIVLILKFLVGARQLRHVRRCVGVGETEILEEVAVLRAYFRVVIYVTLDRGTEKPQIE